MNPQLEKESGDRSPHSKMMRLIQILPLVVCVQLCGCGDPIDRLAAQLQNDDVEQRRDAARALGELGAEAAPAAGALSDAVSDKDREVRRLCCYALGRLGQSSETSAAAESALPQLVAALDDAEFSVQLAAALAIARIDPKTDPQNIAHVPVLTKAMKMDGGVIVAVAELGEKADWATPTLIELLSDKRPGIRRLAAEALAAIGPHAQQAVPALRQAVRDRDDRVREAAQSALQKVDAP